MALTAKDARDYALNLAYVGMIRLALVLPYRRRVAFMGWVMARLVAPLAGYDKRVRQNLALAMPGLSESDIRRLVREVPDNFGRSLIEIYSAAEFAARVRRVEMRGPGVQALEQARHSKTPVILVTGHFGNYDAPRSALISHGFPVGGLYSPMHNRFFNAHYVAAISALGTPVFPRSRSGLAELVRFLRRGGFVGMVVDQHVPRGARLRFFGQPAMTALSPAEMALKYGALMVPIYGIRRPNGIDFDILVEAPIASGDPETMTQALNDGLEALVRQHPGQWFWVHRRWKAAADHDGPEAGTGDDGETTGGANGGGTG